MNALRLAVTGLLVLGVTGFAAGEKKEEKKASIVGTWTASKVDPGTIPEGAVVEFAKDGKFKMTGKGPDEKMEGTYKLEGEKVALIMKVGTDEKKQSLTIKKLSDTELVLVGPDGKTVEFKVKK